MKRILKNEFYKHAFTLLSGSSIAQLFPLLLYPVITRLYNPDELGLLALFMSIAGLLSIPFTGRYEPAIMLPDKDDEAKHLLALSILLSIVSFLFFQGVFSFFSGTIANLLNLAAIKPWLYWIPFFSLMFAVFQVLKYYANRKKDFFVISTGNVSNSMVTGGLKVVFGLISSFRYLGLIVATIIGQSVATIWLMVHRVKRCKPGSYSLSVTEMKRMAKKFSVYPKYNLFHAFANSLSSNVPIFILTSYFSVQVVGLYSLAFGVAFRPLNLFSSSILQVTSQKIIEKYNQQLPIYKSYKRLLLFYLKWMTLPFVLVFVFAPGLFSFLFGSEWTSAGVYLRYLLPWLYMLMFVSPLSFTPELFFRQKKAMIIDFIYLISRILALYTGVLANNVYLGLGLFSLTGVLVMGYNLTWYLNMAGKADARILDNKKQQ
jgi:O-antigen/teichoic acid export membrane protein